MKYLRLSNPEGFFVDTDTGFLLWRDEVRPAHEALGGKTALDWLQAGGIIFCTADGTPLTQQPHNPRPSEREVPFCLPKRIYDAFRELPGGLKVNVVEAMKTFKQVSADIQATWLRDLNGDFVNVTLKIPDRVADLFMSSDTILEGCDQYLKRINSLKGKKKA